MALPADDISNTRALVIEGNPGMRTMLVGQLRDIGVKTVNHCGRITDARRILENQTFDFVLCELHFHDENASGQDLLNDLRRNQLLPFSTVFVMITGEASYSKVAEAAESALDGYLLKPHKPSQLSDRLQQSRLRKLSLQDIFTAIEEADFATAARLCMERFQSRGEFWLYAARIGAELLLRLEQPAAAKTLYDAVIKAKTVPWAQLGVARSMLDGGQPAAAISTLENMIAADPSYSDAYDVMGRAQFEMGKFDEALATYKLACELTPASIGRLQSFGMMSFYAGQVDEAEATLRRTALLGLDSRIFDCQSLVIMALVQFGRKDSKGLQRCVHDFARLLDRDPENERTRRLSRVVDTLVLLQHHKIAQALQAVREMVKEVVLPDFDFEAASNLVALLAQLAQHAIQLDEVFEVIDKVALRFCSSRAMSELLAGAAKAHPVYADHIRSCNAKILKFAEYAMLLSMRGDPSAAVKELLKRADETLNNKLLDSANSVLERYSAKIDDLPALQSRAEALRLRCAGDKARVKLGEGQRRAGALTLRVRVSPKR